MPKVKDKTVRGQLTRNERASRSTTATEPQKMLQVKGGGKTRKRVNVHKDAVLEESNQQFDRPKNFKGANWTRIEKTNLFIAANARRKFLKGHYEFHSGGNSSRTRAWEEVAAYVNEVSVQHRTVAQCRNKVGDFAGDAKDKLRVLKKAMAKTGRGESTITEDMKLLPEDHMALDYAGDEAVTGIPGTRPSTLFRHRPKREVAVPWTSYRPDKLDYYAAFKPPNNEGHSSHT